MKRARRTPIGRLVAPLSVLLSLVACTDETTNVVTPAATVDASNAPPELLAQLDVVSEITGVRIASPPVVTFTMKTAGGVPIVGLVPYWEANSRFVRFTITKLVPGTEGDQDAWVAYVRDRGEPDYDTGTSLVDNGDGSYAFTFATDVRNVDGVPYEPRLTHRVAGQIGQLSTVPLEEQNVWYDFVPSGGPVVQTRDIVTMESCNECHSNLVFHGRRFETQYCVQCHNPDLAEGEGNFSFMIHRIHSSGSFEILDDGADFSEVTYPQDLANCRKCHDGANEATPDGDNWMLRPTIEACDGCHDVFATGSHSGPDFTTNKACVLCHGPGEPDAVALKHTTSNATPHNPDVLAGQRIITYELLDAVVQASNEVTVRFRILDDGTALDPTHLPADLVNPATMAAFRYPGFLLAWAMPQDGIQEPADYTNTGRRSAQPLSVGLGDFLGNDSVGLLTFDPTEGVATATILEPAAQFPPDSTLRAVALQGYLQQDLDGDGKSDVSLHTPSVVVPVTGDAVRRQVVDSENCSKCHEWFEGHGGNRVLGFGSDIVCTLCHVPNLSSSGRTIDPADNDLADELGPDPLVFPEDAQNFKDLIHGIHSSGFRTRHFEHVRGGRQGYYDWSEVTFPRGATTNHCSLCHAGSSYELPLDAGLLPTTVRTTSREDGLDGSLEAVESAFQGVPNVFDWVNTPEASSCAYCHTSAEAFAHIRLNGGSLSSPQVEGGEHVGRTFAAGMTETCSVCHGPGRIADLEVVHSK